MRRYILGPSCFFSLALCVGTLALWMRSYHHRDGFYKWWFDHEKRIAYQRSLRSGSGSIGWSHFDRTYHNQKQFDMLVWRDGLPWKAGGPRYHGRWRFVSGPGGGSHRLDTAPRRWGFELFRSSNHPVGKDGFDVLEVRVPHWLVAGLFAIPPAAWAVRRGRKARRARRIRRGLCPACGYDLRASGGVCPECGRAVTRQPDGAARSDGA